MATLTTRINGQRFTIRNGLAGAYVGRFEPDVVTATGERAISALPFGMRSTYECPVTYPILQAAVNDVLNVEFDAYLDCWCEEIGNLLCDECKQRKALFDFGNALFSNN